VIQVFNRGAERLLGVPAQQVIGKVKHLKFHDPREVQQRREALGKALGRPASIAELFTDPAWLGRPREWTYRRGDGRHVPVSLILTPMHGHSGDVTGILGVVMDITERKQFEHSLEQATARAEAASRAKSEFLANMSHEIRSPLNAVLGLIYLLRQSVLDAEQRSFLDRIKLASDTLLQTINDVLDISKVEAGELVLVHEPFQLPDTVSDLVGLMGVHAMNKGLPIELTLAQGLPARVIGDGMRLTQVLTNLLSNAVKFTERGQVSVQVEWQAIDATQGKARLSVRDTGIGMTSDAVGRVFEPFMQADNTTTRRFGGTGLGLSIVKRLVELMGGQLGVHSQPGVGSEFWVELPFEVADDSVQPSARELLLRPDALAGKTLLVVDDSDINRDVARRILERKGARVVLAENGAQAVEAVRQDDPPIDLVLMDVHMPVMDGFEATRAIRQQLQRSQLPILALTAGATTGERETARTAGMDDFVTKPFEPARLLRIIVDRLGVHDALAPAQDTLPAAATEPRWPQIEGIDMAQARDRLSHDLPLFVSMLRRFVQAWPQLVAGDDLDDARVRDAAIHDVHKFCGTAGTLGMTQLHAQAVALEACLRDRQSQRAGTLFAPLNATLARLRAACAPFLAAHEPRDAAPVDADVSAAVDARQLDELLDLLRRKNMRATTAFERLAPALQVRLGSRAFLALKEHV
jgi:PAS domain S-box-containing protein